MGEGWVGVISPLEQRLSGHHPAPSPSPSRGGETSVEHGRKFVDRKAPEKQSQASWHELIGGFPCFEPYSWRCCSQPRPRPRKAASTICSPPTAPSLRNRPGSIGRRRHRHVRHGHRHAGPRQGHCGRQGGRRRGLQGQSRLCERPRHLGAGARRHFRRRYAGLHFRLPQRRLGRYRQARPQISCILGQARRPAGGSSLIGSNRAKPARFRRRCCRRPCPASPQRPKPTPR